MLGTSLTIALARHHDLVIVGNSNPLPKGKWQSIATNLLEENLSSLLEEVSPDIVVNAAALASDQQCAANPSLAMQLNVELPTKLATLCCFRECTFIHLSTDQVYDGKDSWYTEQPDPTPINQYGISKYNGEQQVLDCNSDAIVLRLALVYGTGTAAIKVPFSSWLNDQLAAGKPVSLFNDEYRTAIYMHDIGSLLHTLCSQSITGGCYNAGGIERYNRFEFAELLCDVFNHDHQLLIPVSAASMDFAEPRPADCSMNIDKLCTQVKWRPKTTLQALIDMRSHFQGAKV